MLDLTLSKQYYALVGKLLLQTRPDVARELVSPFAEAPFETDLTKIHGYYGAFCGITDTPGTRTDKVMHQRLFIASMLHLYNPSAYHQPPDCITLRYGLVRNLAKAMGASGPNISVMIREVILWEKQYDDFKREVEGIVEQLKGGMNG